MTLEQWLLTKPKLIVEWPHALELEIKDENGLKVCGLIGLGCGMLRSGEVTPEDILLQFARDYKKARGTDALYTGTVNHDGS